MNTAVSIRATLLAACLASVAAAEGAVITFDSLVGTTTPNGALEFAAPLTTDGFSFTVPSGAGAGKFASWTAASNANTAFSNFTGTTSLFSNLSEASTMVAANGSAFDALSVDVAQLLGNNILNSVVTFTGTLAAGGTIAQNYTIPRDLVLHTVALTGFTGLSSLELKSAVPNTTLPNYFQFDNINVQAVPEPTSMAALALGAVALVRRRRKA